MALPADALHENFHPFERFEAIMRTYQDLPDEVRDFWQHFRRQRAASQPFYEEALSWYCPNNTGDPSVAGFMAMVAEYCHHLLSGDGSDDAVYQSFVYGQRIVEAPGQIYNPTLELVVDNFIKSVRGHGIEEFLPIMHSRRAQ